MNRKFVLLLSLFFIGCGKPKTFVLEDYGNDKYYLSDSVKIAFKKGQIERAPLIAIDGVTFDYKKSMDTIVLPLKKEQIASITFINDEGSPTIYGPDADNGAIIINTRAIQERTTDTIQSESGN
ncbi:MAG: hypothetical protein ACTHJ5_08500 [Ilyomonas sp.]